MEVLQSVFNTFTNWFHGLGQKPVKSSKKFKGLVAHRGVHGQGLAMENSMQAFELAAKNKIYGIEFDVRWTRDDVAVIYHDHNLGRLHHQPMTVIRDTDLKKLRQIAPDIPTLQELADQLGGRVHFMIELKEVLENDNQHQYLSDALSKLTVLTDFHFMSLDEDILDSLRGFSNEAKVNIAWYDMEKVYRETLDRKHGGLTGHFVLLRDRHRKTLDELNIPYGTGFIETEGTLYKEIARGCTWAFTDVPLKLKAFLN